MVCQEWLYILKLVNVTIPYLINWQYGIELIGFIDCLSLQYDIEPCHISSNVLPEDLEVTNGCAISDTMHK